VVAGEEPSGAAEARRDLVADEQGVVATRERADLAEILDGLSAAQLSPSMMSLFC